MVGDAEWVICLLSIFVGCGKILGGRIGCWVSFGLVFFFLFFFFFLMVVFFGRILFFFKKKKSSGLVLYRSICVCKYNNHLLPASLYARMKGAARRPIHMACFSYMCFRAPHDKSPQQSGNKSSALWRVPIVSLYFFSFIYQTVAKYGPFTVVFLFLSSLLDRCRSPSTKKKNSIHIPRHIYGRFSPSRYSFACLLLVGSYQ